MRAFTRTTKAASVTTREERRGEAQKELQEVEVDDFFRPNFEADRPSALPEEACMHTRSLARSLKLRVLACVRGGDKAKAQL